MKKILLIPAGLLAGLLSLEGALRLPWNLLWNTRPFSPEAEIRILSLGESTTQGGFSRDDSYPFILETLLQESCPKLRVKVWNAGLAGASSSDLRRDLPAWIAKARPQIATIMMGINDLQGMDGPIGAVGRSPWRVWRLWNWITASLTRIPAPTVENAPALSRLGRWDYYRLVTQPLQDEMKAVELEAIHRAVLKVNPSHQAAKIDLGNLLRITGRSGEALEWHRAALREAPEDPWILWEEIADLDVLGRRSEALPLADKLIRNAATLPVPLVTNMATFLEQHKETARLNLLLDGAVNREQAQPILQSLLANVRAKQNKQSASAARARAEAASLMPYPPGLAENYTAIVAELKTFGAHVVPMSYPRQPVTPLNALFEDLPALSLQEPFNDAVAKEGYGAIFYDAFGGNFGHLTKHGNRILAEQLQRRLLKEEPLKSACP